MRVVKRRSPWIQAATVLGGFVLGPFCASRMSALLAPGSFVVDIAAFLGFAMIFMGGTFLWMGLGVATVVLRGLRQLAGGQRTRVVVSEDTESMVPPGYRSYWVLGAALGTAVGLLAGILSPLSIPVAVLAWGLSGLAYGALLWAAAHHGYLPFPEPE